MNKKIIIGAVIVALLVGGLYITKNKSSSPLTTQNKTVNFGAVLALTGYAVNEGTQIKNGIELAKKDLALEGITMNVEYYDDATDPKKTIAGVELMNSKGYKTIFGPTWSYQVTAALPILTKYNMTAFIGDTSSDIVEGDSTQKARLVHGVSPAYQIEEPTTAWIKEHNIKKLAVLTVDGTWGIVYTTAWKKSALNAGAETKMVEMFTYENEPTALATLIVKAKAEGVDGIVWTGTEAGAIALIKKMKEINYDVPVLGTIYLKLAVDTGKISKGNLDLYEIEDKSTTSFKEKYQKEYGVAPGAIAEPSYDLAIIAAKAELEKGTKTTQEYILSKEHKGYGRTYKFDEKRDVTNHGWIITEVK